MPNLRAMLPSLKILVKQLDSPLTRILGLVAIFLIVVWIIIVVPIAQVNTDLALGIISPRDIPISVDSYRKTILQAVGGFILLFGLYLTWRRINVTEDGQVTERYSRAIEQLGDENRISVRLGGIYALERIARDSLRDRNTVMEVLCAFIRDQSQKQEGRSKPTTDVQAALTVLMRREITKSGEGIKIDLREANLFLAQLFQGNFSNALFANATLDRAIAAQADFSSASFYGASLVEGNFTQSNLEGATLWRANMQNCILLKANCKGSNLKEANLAGAMLTSADLSHADLSGANLTGASLVGAKMEGVILKDTIIDNTFPKLNIDQH